MKKAEGKMYKVILMLLVFFIFGCDNYDPEKEQKKLIEKSRREAFLLNFGTDYSFSFTTQ